MATSAPATTTCWMLFFADDLVERIDDFLDVKQMEVVGAALITRLRPSALRGAAGLFADDLLFALGVRRQKTRMRALLVSSITAA